MELFLKTFHKDRFSVRYDGFQNTVVADNMCNV
jgi:hypothetical protein